MAAWTSHPHLSLLELPSTDHKPSEFTHLQMEFLWKLHHY
jgi:hypothetical protein